MNIRGLEILGVLPEFRGHGIGRQLLRTVEVETGELVPRQGIYVEATSQENVSTYVTKRNSSHSQKIHSGCYVSKMGIRIEGRGSLRERAG